MEVGDLVDTLVWLKEADALGSDPRRAWYRCQAQGVHMLFKYFSRQFLAAAILLACASFAHAQSLFDTVDPSGKIPGIAPVTGQNFRTSGAGILRSGRNLGFFWMLEPTHRLDHALYVKVTYPNPCGAELVNDATIDPKLEKIGLSSPEYILGMKKDAIYKFRAEFFNSREDKEPIEVIEQGVLSIFDGWGCD